MRIKKWFSKFGFKTASNEIIDSLDEIAAQYPRLYSEHKFLKWGSLFEKNAIISKVGRSGIIWSMPINKFLRRQIQIAKNNKHVNEKWQNVTKNVYGNIAVMHAEYVLENDTKIINGHDVLLLVKGRLGWRIKSLIYEEERD